MATPPSLVQFAFASGIDESQQSEVLDPTAAFPVGQNVRQPHRGAWEKRLGYVATTKNRLSGARSAGRRATDFNGAPVVIDGSFLDSYAEVASLNVTRARVAEATYRLLDLPEPTASTAIHDVEYCNGFVAVTYGSSLTSSTALVGSTSIAVQSVTDGSTVLSNTSIGTGLGITTVGSFSGRYFIACHYNDSTTLITTYLLDTQALATGWVSQGTLVATSSNAYPAICSLSDRVAVVYGTTSGATRVTAVTLNAAGVVQTQALTAASTPGKISVDGSTAGTLWIAFSQGTAVHAIGLSASTLSSTLATDVSALTATTGVINLGITEGSAAGTARVWVLSNTSPRVDMCGLTTVAGAAVAGTATTSYGWIPVSRGFQQGGRYYLAVAPSAATQLISGNTQGLCVVVDWTPDLPDLRPIANLEPGLAPGCSFFCKFTPTSTSKRMYGFQVVKAGLATLAGLVSGIGTGGCAIAELDFGSRNRWLPAKHNGSLYLGGALLSVYDGDNVAEAGFVARPTQPTTSLAGGALSPTTGYRYVAIYESVDASGNVIVSGISDPTGVIKPVVQNVTVSANPCTVSARAHRIAFYRTNDGGEAPYYRIGTVIDSGVAASFSFVDTVADVSANAQLYAPTLPSTPNEKLDRRAPPGLVHIVSYAGTLVGAKGATLFQSGQQVYGEATWFSPLLQSPLPGTGSITGLVASDGTLFVFLVDRIYSVAGEAPSDNGAAGGLGTPRLLAGDIGCIEPNSIVVTATGIFFQSARGIELMDRGGGISPIGWPIRNTLATYPVVTSAVLDQRSGLVRFTIAASESAGAVSGVGRDVVYDLRLQTWQSVDDKTGSSAHEAAQSAAYVYLAGAWRYAWLGVDGALYYERDTADASAYLDGSTWVTMAAETASVKQGGIQGHQHLNQVLLLARKSTDVDLSVSLAYNYEASFRAARTFSNAEISSLLAAGWPITQLKHFSHDDADCEGVRVRVADAIPTSGTVGNGKGATWIALTLDITPEPGVFDVPEGAV